MNNESKRRPAKLDEMQQRVDQINAYLDDLEESCAGLVSMSAMLEELDIPKSTFFKSEIYIDVKARAKSMLCKPEKGFDERQRMNKAMAREKVAEAIAHYRNTGEDPETIETIARRAGVIAPRLYLSGFSDLLEEIRELLRSHKEPSYKHPSNSDEKDCESWWQNRPRGGYFDSRGGSEYDYPIIPVSELVRESC